MKKRRYVPPDPIPVLVEGLECVGIPLTQDMVAIVDKSDATIVSPFIWFASKEGTRNKKIWYAKRVVLSSETHLYETKQIRMHTFLTGIIGIDHANNNGLDNRRINLRPANQSQNIANSDSGRQPISGFRGVVPEGNRWKAQIQIKGRKFYLGLFPTPTQAAIAYNNAAFSEWGNFARLNTIPEPTFSR